MFQKLRATVTMEDGTVYETETRYADYVAYEAESRKRGWGDIGESAMTSAGYVAYRALIRSRQISMPWERFLEQVADLEARPITPPKPIVESSEGPETETVLSDQDIADVTPLSLGKERQVG